MPPGSPVRKARKSAVIAGKVRHLQPQAERIGADERIHRAICDAILDRRLQPGTHLNEIELGEFFGVSRTIVHKALIRLSQSGVVSLRPKRVAMVVRPSIAETRAVFEARRAIEAAVVPLVARAGEAALRELRAAVDEEVAAYARGDRVVGIRLSVRFHQRLAALSGNPALARYLDELVLHTSLIIALYESASGTTHPHAEHEQIVAALAAGDVAAATAAMVEHLLELEHSLDLHAREAPASLAAIFGAGAGHRAATAGGTR